MLSLSQLTLTGGSGRVSQGQASRAVYSCTVTVQLYSSSCSTAGAPCPGLSASLSCRPLRSPAVRQRAGDTRHRHQRCFQIFSHVSERYGWEGRCLHTTGLGHVLPPHGHSLAKFPFYVKGLRQGGRGNNYLGSDTLPGR